MISGRWHDNAACTHNRLRDKTSHIFRAELQYLIFKICDFFSTELFLSHALGPTVGIWGRDVMNQIRRQIKSLMIERDAGHRHRQISTSMITISAGDDLLLIFLSEPVEIKVNDSYRCIICHRPACTEKDVVQARRGKLRELCRKRHGGRCRYVIKSRVVRDLAHLFRYGLRHLIVTIPNIDAPQTTNTINKFIAVGIKNIGAVGMRHHQRALILKRRKIRPRMNIVIYVFLS